ncbi:pyridoxamine 5'-phosphate oxidase [Rhodopila sp.]|uniref:pyridoxamine 5'-phosphate oxidase n=1 Tax=Rhodopila sp. TaxID=2480087 RepID=UPI002B9401F6|nr:pyridoxamine 5'-phosphate oxidase [Rhodopila sp.]HVZ07736.1 pyridoxamine 5'-phosphate oxidase [Rhodopila sp.]
MSDLPPLDPSPFVQFRAWMADAAKEEINDPNAMIVVTATPDGRPSARAILLKDADDAGFVFYTNKESRKARELEANPHIFLLFFWKSLHRQVRVEGTVTSVTDAEADAYFATRPRVSQLGAWASRQSRALAERQVLVDRVAHYEAEYPNQVPRPPYWSGYRVTPDLFEFWQDMPFRLHDRTIYQRGAGDAWVRSKLFP